MTRRHQHYYAKTGADVTDLFTPPPFDAQQPEELARVTGAIGKAIIGFLRARLNNGMTEFHADELRQWVRAALPTAPASADRVLRDLRSAGIVNYQVVNRRASLYRILNVQ